ncbi:MAG: hypothetical protein QE487_14015 [Fluviicola sp.]|nr:hypothetical protein [Fluviicola sp.]
MELQMLKSSWQNAQNSAKSKTELNEMMAIGNHPTLKRIRLKLVIETIWLIAFLAFYYDAFDGQNKPLWLRLLLISSSLFYLGTNSWGYFKLRHFAGVTSIRQSLIQFMTRLKRLFLLSMISSIVFGSSLVFYFIWNNDLTVKKQALLFGITATAILLHFVSFTNWRFQIRHIKLTLGTIEAEDK